jgi:hypothetical protein
VYWGCNLDVNKPTTKTNAPTNPPTYFVAFNVHAMPSQTCTYCYKTFSSISNYTRHLRTFAAKQEPESVPNRHPPLGSAEFEKLKERFGMWELPGMRESKQERRTERNAKHYDKKVKDDRARVEKEIRLAL